MSDRPARISGWALRIAIFLALAGVISVFQVDNASRERVGLLAWVPPGLGGFADAKVARPIALVKPEMAVDRATAALRHRPIDAGSLAAFAIATVEAGDDELAGQALSLAAQRGWRDTYTQLMVIGSALSSERWDVAAQRIDALARLRRENEAIDSTLGFLVRSDDGRRELARRMEVSVPLVESVTTFLQAYPEFGPEVAQSFGYAQQNHEFTCRQLARVSRLLLVNDMSEAVGDLWPSRCAEAQNAGIGFRFVDTRDDPYAWNFPTQGGVSVRPGSKPGTLTARNRDPLRRNFAMRYLTLEPGDHVLQLDRADAATSSFRPGAQPADIYLAIRCVKSGEKSWSPLYNGPYEFGVRFEVPADCSVQNVSLTMGKGQATDLTISIGR